MKYSKGDEFAEWRGQSSELRDAHGIPRGATPWTSGARLDAVPATPRILDLLDTAFAIRRAQSPAGMTSKEMATDFWIDLATAVGRKPWRSGHPGVFRQNSIVYSYEADAALTGAAQMQLMGWPPSAFQVATSKDADLRSLCGELYSLPMCTLLHMCLFCNPYGGWWRAEED